MVTFTASNSRRQADSETISDEAHPLLNKNTQFVPFSMTVHIRKMVHVVFPRVSCRFIVRRNGPWVSKNSGIPAASIHHPLFLCIGEYPRNAGPVHVRVMVYFTRLYWANS